MTSEEKVIVELQSQPQIFMRLAENALTVAESFRDNYLKNTAKFIASLRNTIAQPHDEPILVSSKVGDLSWSDFSGEVVTFIDGGVGRVQISSQVPILLRVGSYCVRTGERDIAQREDFGYYPVILGDLEGGSKDRADFIDIVRITAELLGGLSALERTPDLRVLMFHGPLVYQMGRYTAGFTAHTPFTENDIDLFLRHYATDASFYSEIKQEFLEEANLYVYPKMTTRSSEWVKQRVFEPLSWIAFLYRRLIRVAKLRTPVPIILGAVERGTESRLLSEVIIERMFRWLRKNERENEFNNIFGRNDLINTQALLTKLNYTDSILLALLLKSGEFSESWEMTTKYEGLGNAQIILPNEAFEAPVNFSYLKPGLHGYPTVKASYIKVTENTDPIRVETFADLGEDQIPQAMERVYLYSRLLPGYGFPVGLDIADKFAKVPNWMTGAYEKLIKFHLGVSLQEGKISDEDMRKILIQAIYFTHRDWLFRPPA